VRVKSHSAHENCTLRVEITLVRVEITFVRFEIILVHAFFHYPPSLHNGSALESSKGSFQMFRPPNIIFEALRQWSFKNSLIASAVGIFLLTAKQIMPCGI
jgi:hypothetical protein